MKRVNNWGKVKTTLLLLAVRALTALLVIAGLFAIEGNNARREQILRLRAALPGYVTITLPSTGSELPTESSAPTYRVPTAGSVMPVSAGPVPVDGSYEPLPARSRPVERADAGTVPHSTSTSRPSKPSDTATPTSLIGWLRQLRPRPASASTSSVTPPCSATARQDQLGPDGRSAASGAEDQADALRAS